MTFSLPVLFCTLATSVSVVLFRQFGPSKSAKDEERPLPPSPPSLPWVGNLFSIPSGFEHLAYDRLGKELNSSIFSLNMFGNNIVVLNTAEAACDLMEKPSAIYSDRVCLPMLGNPEGLNWPGFITFVGYNDLWRTYRRMMNMWLNAKSSTSFHQSQEKQARQLLSRLLVVPKTTQSSKLFEREFSRTMAATIFQSVYGYKVESIDDSFLVGAKKAVENLCKAQMPCNFLVNFFPALAQVPSWMPWTGWKQTAREWREQKEWIVNTAYQWTKTQIADGVAEPSIIRSLLGNSLTAKWSEKESDARLKELGITLFAGGTDTTASALITFVAAMILFPDVQAKAQEEIDSVVGRERLPNITDRAQLPYVQRLILEVFRWQPILPIGVPHLSFRDDDYMGYRIPKGTMVIGNMWAMSRNESVYEDPETFNPDRFLDPEVPALPTFGWGRRKCPGSHYAEASMFIAVASILAAFKFSKAKDSEGNEITPEIEGAANSAIYIPKAFDCAFECRSEIHRQLILEDDSF